MNRLGILKRFSARYNIQKSAMSQRRITKQIESKWSYFAERNAMLVRLLRITGICSAVYVFYKSYQMIFIYETLVNCDSRLDGKVVVITGATSGYGLELARLLSDRGARVIMASRNTANLRSAYATLMEENGERKLEIAHCDLSKLKSVRLFVALRANC